MSKLIIIAHKFIEIVKAWLAKSGLHTFNKLVSNDDVRESYSFVRINC